MRARTMQLISGRVERSRGAGCVDASMGIERGSLWVEGVLVPGVEGGVKAGLSRVGGGSWLLVLLVRSRSRFGIWFVVGDGWE